jgi:hypothetical protein
VVLLEPLARQDLPALLEFGVDELHAACSVMSACDRPGEDGFRRVPGG